MRLDPRLHWTDAETWSLAIVGIAREVVRTHRAGDGEGRRVAILCLHEAVQKLDAAEQAKRPRYRVAV